MSVLENIASANIDAEEARIKGSIGFCFTMLSGFLIKKNPTNLQIEHKIKAMAKGWHIPEYREIDFILPAIKFAYGDPMELFKEGTRLYSEYYYNPTNKDINIAPLGLCDDEGIHIKTVSAEGFVRIPIGYTKGNKKSAVACVAPQLQRIEREMDRLIDLQPVSHKEWIKHFSYGLTLCCHNQAFWSDINQKIFCGKCKKKVSVYELDYT